MAADAEILREFLIESKENLDALDQSLVGLERNPDDRSLVDTIFRSLHSTKGAAGFLEFPKLEAVAHAGENLLNAIRDGAVQVDTNTTSLLLSVLDAMREMLASIEHGGVEGERDDSELIGRLEAATPGAGPTHAPAAHAPAAPPSAAPAMPTPPAAPARPAAAPPPAAASPSARADASEDSGETIRVDVNILDELMDLVGELVLSRNQILQLTSRQLNTQLNQSSQQLNRITTELQERVMKTRMQPIKQVWSRLPRVVRDLSVQLNKQVRVEMEGKETELDRSLVESIKDPLTHLVRNAIDHGIETPEQRIAAGKDPEGLFTLRAYHESGQVIIEVADDGAGIDPERIKRKAVEKGVITEDQAATMASKEALHLIFKAGFSTAERVTNISGRGVGMDVVRSNIEKIGGSIDVESQPGRGTRFRIKIPLTLAIIPALMVRAAGASFAIPQVNVVELVRLKQTEEKQAVEVVQGTITTRLRGRILPLVDLRELLAGRNSTSPSPATTRKGPDLSLHIAVLQANKKKFGLIVDRIEESQEIVVKPLGRQLQDVSVYAGATILGDGTLALILDTLGVAQESGLFSEDESFEAQAEEEAAAAARELTQTVLLVEDADDGRLAIPLSSIARLEKFPMAKIEIVGGHEVVQYGEHILRLVRTGDVVPAGGSARRAAPSAPRSDAEHVYVVVFNDRDTPVGMVMERILDVVETPVSKLKPPTRRGIVGTGVVRERVTEFLDVDAMMRCVRQEAAAHA